MRTNLTGILGICVLVALPGVPAAGEPGMLGGKDVQTMRLTCSEDERMTGAEFRYGHWVDAVRIFCTPFDSGNEPSGPKRISEKAGGNGGNESVTAECAAGSWVAGASAKAIDQMILHGKTTARDYVARVRLACVDGNNNRTDLAETAPVAGYGYVTHGSGCPAGQAASGFDVHGDGGSVTGLGLLCAARPGLKSAAPAALPAASSSLPERIAWPGTEPASTSPSLAPAERQARIKALTQRAGSLPYGSPESNAAWEEAAALGHVYARGLMANRFCRGETVRKDERRCHSIYLLLAEEGHAPSQEMVGRQYLNGQGTAKDIHAARYWLERAANQGNAAAMGLLGNIYDPAENLFPDMNLAIFWKRMSYKNGNDIAYHWLQQRNLLERAPDEQAFITRIETRGPDRSNLANFNHEVSIYCQYGGKQCNAFRSEGYRLEKAQNARAEANNMQRLWDIYRRESEDPQIRTKCLQRATETLHKATYGQQSWYYSAENC